MKHKTLMTIAELSNYKETGRLEEVERLSAEWARAWPDAVRSFEFGRSAEGRIMRALLISRSGALTPEALRAKAVPLLMIQGGIHPGESDGKDGGFAALRDLLGDSSSNHLLQRIAVLFVPAFNTDGHERVGRWSRPNQNGPIETGWRTTAQNINLNRDYMKADTPEMRAMLRLIDVWDPLVCADLHVTDGADFEPDISLQVEPLNQGDANLRVSGRQMRDALIARLTELKFLALDFYPDLASADDPASGFALTVYSPRFSTGYFPQRNRFTVLVETHSWKDYARRVHMMRDTINSLAELVAAHGRNWLELAHQADQAAIKLGGAEMALDFKSSWREPAQAGGAIPDRDASTAARTIEFRGYAYTRTPSRLSGALVTTYDPKTPQIWRVPLRDQVEVSISATVPLGGYVVPAAFAADIARRLDAHGIAFSRLTGAAGENQGEGISRHGGAVFRGSFRRTHARTSERRLARRNVRPRWMARCSCRLHSLWRGWWWRFSSRGRRTPSPRGACSTPASSRRSTWNPMSPSRSRRKCSNKIRSSPPNSTAGANRMRRSPRVPVRALEFFLRRHASWDSQYNLYPVRRAEASLESRALRQAQEAGVASAVT